jgi:signal transduction histidine kinase
VEAALRDAERESRIKDEFLTTLSHELRTPINAILGWAHLLQGGRLDEATKTKAVDVIARNAMALTELVGDILDMQRVVSGKMRLDLKETDVGAAVRAAVDTVQPSAAAKDIDLRVAADSPVTVWGDPERLQQVVWNLLSNAVKFTPRGGHVSVRVSRVGSQAEIQVEDNGPGIPPAFLPYVFERFRQADSSATRQHGGLGLGLAIVRSLVELHGGTVRAENAEGGTGALFTVSLAAPNPPPAT